MEHVTLYAQAVKKQKKHLEAKRALKLRYNELLGPFNAPEAYIDDRKIPTGEHTKRLREYNRLASQLSRLLEQIGEHTHREAVEGFKV
jgi:hypothetical protein